jgi:hypothetical protein
MVFKTSNFHEIATFHTRVNFYFFFNLFFGLDFQELLFQIKNQHTFHSLANKK